MQSSSSCSLPEWHFDDFRTDEEEQQRDVRFASVDDDDLPVGASAVGEAKAVYDSIISSTDGFQYVDPQKMAQATSKMSATTQKHDVGQTAGDTNLVPEAGTDEVEDFGVRGWGVVANLTSCAESLELPRSAVEAYLAKHVADLQASPLVLAEATMKEALLRRSRHQTQLRLWSVAANCFLGIMMRSRRCKSPWERTS